ncbi:14735_t:CDS:2, partial [Funneliformis mosseae]
VRVYPNSSQKNLLKQWMGCGRLVYNMVVTNFNHGHLSTHQFWFQSLLKLKISHTLKWSFMKDYPYEVLDQAITHAIQA